MLNNLLLRILSDKQKKNYIIKNKDKLSEEDIIKIIQSSKAGLAIFSSYELSNLNVSNNTFFNLLSELSNDKDKIQLYEPNIFSSFVKFDLKECDNDTVIKFINSFKNDADKLKYKYDFWINDKVLSEILNHVSDKINFIMELSSSLNSFTDYLYNYQKQSHEFSD